MRRLISDCDCILMYEVYFYKNIFGTKAWEIEFNTIFDEEPGVHWFTFENLEACKEFAKQFLNTNQEYICSNILLNIFDNYDDWNLLESYPIWDCIAAEEYTDKDSKSFFRNVNIDNHKN